jgi:hypothetical protein
MIKTIIKSFWETILLGDNPIARTVRYFSSYEELQRWKKYEMQLTKLRSAKYETEAIVVKQLGMAMERESQARELESKANLQH